MRVLLGGLLLLSASCFGQDSVVTAAIERKTASLSAMLVEEVRRSTVALDDAAVNAYVEQLGRRLARGGDAAQSWSFSVITDNRGGSTYEPVSLPGGQIFVPVRLILAAESEAELAAMMAHAMGHVTAGHGKPGQVPGAQVVNTSSIPLIFMGGWMGLGDGGGLALPAAVLEQHRGWELEADRAGVQLLSESGFDAAALVHYIERTQQDRGQARHSALPPKAERTAALRTLVGDGSAQGRTTDEFHGVQIRVRELTESRQSVKREPPSLKRPNER